MKIRLLRADIESLKIDAIASPSASADAASRAAVVTGGNLLARFVIHVPVPKITDPDVEARLRAAALTVIERAEELAVAAVGLPPLVSPHPSFPYDRIARPMLEAAIAHQTRARSLQVVIFCLYGAREYDAFSRALEELQPS